VNDIEQDSLLVGVILFGAALQSLLDGPWLLLCGSLAMGVRIAFAREDRRGIAATVLGCVFWLVLHLAVSRRLTRVQVSVEVLTCYCFVLLFWVARLINRERVLGEARRLELAREVTRDERDKLGRLRIESENMNRESDDLTRLFGVTKNIGEVIREDEMMEVIKLATRTYLKLPAWVLLLPRDGMIHVRAQEGFDDAAVSEAAWQTDAPSLVSWLMGQREPVLVDSLEADDRFTGSLFPFRSLLALPMLVRDETVGVLTAFDIRPRAFTRQDYTRAGILAKQIALGLGKTQLYSRIEELSITDGLTKLYRHRYFQERFDGELERARRYSRPVSLLLSDLDHFKRYNDTYGHPEGDEMLKHVSRLMEQYFRRPGILARYGGEEFAVLLPDTGKDGALSMAEAFRAALASSPGPVPRSVLGASRDAAGPRADAPRPPQTISIGVATFPEDAQTRRDLIARADLALYQAKADGRNRACGYTLSLVPRAAAA